MASLTATLNQSRRELYSWLNGEELPLGVTITLWIALMAAASWIAIPLPFTPVPVTLQVLAVLLMGYMLGSKRAFYTQISYLALGAVGAPIYAQAHGGVPHLFGPSGGYLLAFPIAAWIAGYAKESGFLSKAGFGLLSILVIYLGGAGWLMGLVQFAGFEAAEQNPFSAAYYLGIAPFAGIDLAKLALAIGAARFLKLSPTTDAEPRKQG